VVGCAALGRGGEDSRVALLLTKTVYVGVDLDICELAVVQASAPHLFVVQVEAQWLNQVQRASRIGTQANDVACIGWNLRLKQDNVQHEASRPGRLSN